MRFLLAILTFAVINISNSLADSEVKTRNHRKGKLFSVFQVVSFANAPCEGSGNRNGTCFTEQECESMGGTESGTCASGFGICCIFTIGCGQTSSQNCTYFESTGATAGGCVVEICPCNDNICQLRLDFETFVISGPSVITNSVSKRRKNSGAITAKAKTISVTEFGQCLTDTFSVSNPDGPNPPTICGMNTGEHMYVEASDDCNRLAFTLGNMGIGTAIAARTWNIKVNQFSCNFNNLAPKGCTQFFYGGMVNSVRSYNYNNGNSIHLASQDQAICVRRERNMCRICWSTVNPSDFALTGSQPKKRNNPNLCCDYAAPSTTKANSQGGMVKTKEGFDCVLVPNALRHTNNEGGAPLGPKNSAYCGNNLGLKGGTICSTRAPFVLHFRSDLWETVTEAKVGGQKAQAGFMLVYVMDATNCLSTAILG